MKTFTQIIEEQRNDVEKLRSLAYKINSEKITPNNKIIGALLTGSVARGDARIAPFGIKIDLAIIVKNKSEIDLDKIFGINKAENFPYHCVTFEEKVGIQIELIEEYDLWKIREKHESDIYAKNESIILNDKNGILKKWKDEYFNITNDQLKQRALRNYWRFCYLTGDYRLEKWQYRKAYIQINQNFNEASECYCNFLYCINKQFIPRRDWLAYLTYELKIKPVKHESYMNNLYTAILSEEFILQKNDILKEIKNWMEEYCKDKSWL